MSNRIKSGSFALLIALALSTSAQAQDRYLNEIYGQGVHTYWSGNTSSAQQSFSSVINMGMNDPRPFYFRAITHLKSGNDGAAQSDIRQGATLEVSGSGNYNIGHALQRVQGPHRICFENMRRHALLEATRARAAQQKLAPPTPADYPQTTGPDLNTPPVFPGADDDNPFKDDDSDGDGGLSVDPPAEVPAGDDGGFGDDPEPAMDDDGGDDLFGDDPEPADDGGDDAGDDLFGDEPAGDDPAMDDSGDGGDDLFGDDPDSGADGDEGDIFGDDAGSDDLDAGGDDLDAGDGGAADDTDDLFGDLDEDESTEVAETNIDSDDVEEEASVGAVDLDDLFDE